MAGFFDGYVVDRKRKVALPVQARAAEEPEDSPILPIGAADHMTDAERWAAVRADSAEQRRWNGGVL